MNVLICCLFCSVFDTLARFQFLVTDSTFCGVQVLDARDFSFLLGRCLGIAVGRTGNELFLLLRNCPTGCAILHPHWLRIEPTLDLGRLGFLFS